MGAACSSSFYALHSAVQDIQRGAIDYALVGGSSAVLRPATSIAFDRLQCAPPALRKSPVAARLSLHGHVACMPLSSNPSSSPGCCEAAALHALRLVGNCSASVLSVYCLHPSPAYQRSCKASGLPARVHVLCLPSRSMLSPDGMCKSSG